MGHAGGQASWRLDWQVKDSKLSNLFTCILRVFCRIQNTKSQTQDATLHGSNKAKLHNNTQTTLIASSYSEPNPTEIMDFTELMSSGKLMLYSTSLSLLWGKSWISAAVSGSAIYIFYSNTKTATTKNIEQWIILGSLTLLASIASGILTVTSENLEDPHAVFNTWVISKIIQKGMGLILAGFIFLEVNMKKTEPEDRMQFLQVKIHILKGRNLVAKDRNFIGRKTSSDPYVVVHHGPTQLGKTSIIKKTLDPEWDNEVFRVSVVPRALEIYRTIELNIFDHDNLSPDDPMGTVHIRIPTTPNKKEMVWHTVERGEGRNYCRNATGELLVLAEVQGRLNSSFKLQLQKTASQRVLGVQDD